MNGSLLFIISGPAGSGKGSVVAEVLRRDDRFMCAVSATTRPCLAGEVDGVNYYYISREAFEEKIRTHGVLEYTEYCGNYYGTLKSEVERAKSLGKHLILEIEVDGNVSFENAKKMRAAGATMFVGGSSSVFHKGGTLCENIQKLNESVGK